jgi:predicted nucleotidyltransferase
MASLADASLTAEERRVVERLVELLREEFGPDLHAVWLYGSRARGEPPHPDSDVDLLVITSGGQERDLLRAIELEFRATRLVGAHPAISVHVFDPEWVTARRPIDSFFMREVDRDKLVLFPAS